MPDIPHLRKQGTATQLIVEGKPFLILGGELHNSSASSLAYMEPIWGRLRALNLNTALAVVSWELTEPEEGRFDFSLVDGLVREARRHDLRLVLLWFGSWKNAVSSYVPGWVKTDLARFPRAQRPDGTNLEVLSCLSDANRDADARAFAALMRHLREIDSHENTVLMVQVENEVGLLGDSRDRSPRADASFSQDVPAQLMEYLAAHRQTLVPELLRVWEKAGFPSHGSWAAVFGEGPDADEAFMAWHTARYVGEVAAAGKREYALPLFANAWLIQAPEQLPGGYPSGGPVSKVLDIWRAAAPSLDFLAPDIYLPDFRGVCASYARSGNPLFIPEAARGPQAAANVFYALGAHGAIGFCPFGIDSLPGDHPLGTSYRLLASLSARIAERQGTDRIGAVLEEQAETERVMVGGYQIEARFDRRDGEDSRGCGLFLALGNDEFLVAGQALSLAFSAASPGPRLTRILSADEGQFEEGRWVPGRRLNGDETAGGARILLPRAGFGLQRVRLYRHD